MGNLKSTVIDGGYCIGCGACTAVQDSSFGIMMDEWGRYQATPKEGESEDPSAEQVCPFSDESRDETEIGHDLYGEHAIFDERVGYHRACYTGYVAEGEFRGRGSSGGMAKWILYEVLRRDLVDAVIQIVAQSPEPENGTIYGYSVIEAPEDVLSGSKSVYYPVEMSGALEYISKYPKRYAITGIPCFIKALRLLAREERVFDECIAFCIGLVCGHLKSKHYADMIAWQFGVEPGDLAHIDFRKHIPNTLANEKGVEVESRSGNPEVDEPDIVQNLFGTNYSHGFFQYKACNFCDDVVGETADISVGDAWLDEYLDDGRGTRIIVIRHPVMQRVVQAGIREGRLHLDPVSVDTVAESQSGGFRHRREGLAYRLQRVDEQGQWRPPKRVKPNKSHITRKRREVYDLRMQMAEESHRSFQKALRKREFEIFREEMEPLIEAYRELYRPTFWQRFYRGVHRRVEWIRQWISGVLTTRELLKQTVSIGSKK